MLYRLAAIGLISIVGLAFAPTEADTLTADEVLQAALDRAKEIDDPKLDFTYLIWEVSEKLDGNGEVTEKETSLLRHIPVRKESHRRLLEKNGKPLSPEEKREQDEKEREFRRQASCQPQKDEDEDRVEFNRDLIGRYKFELVGVEEVNGRPAHILTFVPREGKLPVNRRMDRALNNSQGRIWVDTESYEVSKVHFEMDKPLRIGWGMIGSIRSVEGQVERSPIEDGVWMPNRFDFFLNGRILFRSLHFRERVEWRDFERLPTAEIAAASCD